MKKIFSILLLCCLLLNVIGYHIIFYIRQAEIKSEIRRSLLQNVSNKDQQVFVFSLDDEIYKNELEWEEEDEFRFKGEMYDVIEKKMEGNNLIIRCISDKKETALVNDYNRINNDSNSKSKSALLLKHATNIYFLETNTSFQFLQTLSTVTITFQSEIIASHRADVITPPPEVS